MKYQILLMVLISINMWAMEEGRVIPLDDISDELAASTFNSDEEIGYDTRADQFVDNLKEMFDIADENFDEEMQNYLTGLIQHVFNQIDCLERDEISKTVVNCCGIKKKKRLLTREPDKIDAQKEWLDQFQTKCGELRTLIEKREKIKKKKDKISVQMGEVMSAGAQAALLAILEEAKQHNDEQDNALQETDKYRSRWKYGSIVGGTASLGFLIVQSGIIPPTIGLIAALIESYVN